MSDNITFIKLRVYHRSDNITFIKPRWGDKGDEDECQTEFDHEGILKYKINVTSLNKTKSIIIYQ